VGGERESERALQIGGGGGDDGWKRWWQADMAVVEEDAALSRQLRILESQARMLTYADVC
jgi:hypothetical protein